MNEDSKLLYEEEYKSLGDCPEAFLWSNSTVRDIYFQIVLMVTTWKGQHCLEIGCGAAALYEYITENNLNINYSGIDFNSYSVANAKKKYPDLNVKTIDFLDLKLSDNDYPDYCLAAGTFNFINDNSEARYDFIQTILKKMFMISKKGVSFIFKTNITEDDHHPNYVFYEPCRILEYAFSLSPYATLNHSFSKSIAALYVYR